METPVWVAVIAAGASFFIAALGLLNQKRLEKLKKNLDFETLRFERLHEIKQEIINLAEKNKHSIELVIKHHQENLTQDDLFQEIMKYQDRQVQAVSSARQIYRRNKHLLDKEIRNKLDTMVDILDRNARIALDKKALEKEDPTRITELLEERVNVLEGFIPEFETGLDLQLDKIAQNLSSER